MKKIPDGSVHVCMCVCVCVFVKKKECFCRDNRILLPPFFHILEAFKTFASFCRFKTQQSYLHDMQHEMV